MVWSDERRAAWLAKRKEIVAEAGDDRIECSRCGGPGPFPKDPTYRMCRNCYNTTRRSYKERISEEQLARYRRRSADSQIRMHRKRRVEALRVYGDSRCACCGETEQIFLALDHINDDGAEHRRSLGIKRGMGGGARMYQVLASQGWPPGFQVLCHNCNWAKSRGGCPHAR